MCSCSKSSISDDDFDIQDELYFPPKNGTNWENISQDTLNWRSEEIKNLFNFLSENQSRAFIILVNGKIAIEKYWGKNILGTVPFTAQTIWYWASAGKTLTAFLTGVAQENGILDIQAKSSNYLGVHWSSMPKEKEDLVLVKHHLSMSTGLDYNIPDPGCTSPECFVYKVDAGSQWYYHNGAYTIIQDMISYAAGVSYNHFTDTNIESKIGMKGEWHTIGDNSIYWSTARDAARFGLLLLNKGQWKSDLVLGDTDYFNQMTTSSQSTNPAYGFLTWLNGESSVVLPGSEYSFDQMVSPNAPLDMFMAIGKNGQFIDVIPSEKMVVVRMGEAPDGKQVPLVFHDEMWNKINNILP